MPETGRLLQFRPPSRQCSGAANSPPLEVRDYLLIAIENREDRLRNECLSSPDFFLALCIELKSRCNTDPAVVVLEASNLYRWLSERESALPLFDERDYFLGEAALIAGSACRQSGRRDDAELWFDRAEASFRHTVNPAPLLASVAYARLTLYYDRRQYERVFELLPSLQSSFDRLGMTREGLKCQFLEAMALKETGQLGLALAKLSTICANPALGEESSVEGLVVANYAELLASAGETDQALAAIQALSNRSSVVAQPTVAAHLNCAMAEVFRQKGMPGHAVVALRRAVAVYTAAGMMAIAAYARIILAEALIAARKPREAEWEILAALATIEAQGMESEGSAAVALLRESLKQQEADPSALRNLRQYLQARR